MRIYLRIKPNSHKDEVIQLDSTHYQVNVAAPASQNKANNAVVELMADRLRIAKSLITIVRGQTSKNKTLEINTNQNLPL